MVLDGVKEQATHLAKAGAQEAAKIFNPEGPQTDKDRVNRVGTLALVLGAINLFVYTTTFFTGCIPVLGTLYSLVVYKVLNIANTLFVFYIMAITVRETETYAKIKAKAADLFNRYILFRSPDTASAK